MIMGILIKDILMMRKSLILYFFMIAFLSLGGESALMIPMLYSLMLPMNLMGYDERSRFDRLSMMLPLSTFQRVIDKYLLTYICMVVMCASSIAIISLRTGTLVLPRTMPLYMSVLLVILGITIPLILYFGVERGRIICLLAILALAAPLGVLGSLSQSMTLGIGIEAIGWMALAAGVLINILSVYVSCIVYDKRMTA